MITVLWPFGVVGITLGKKFKNLLTYEIPLFFVSSCCKKAFLIIKKYFGVFRLLVLLLGFN